MKSLYNFVISPLGERYNNIKKVGNKELILNTEIYNHEYINREAIVISCPLLIETDIKPGDKVIVHHNVSNQEFVLMPPLLLQKLVGLIQLNQLYFYTFA